MDIFPNECIYSILLFLNPKYLQLCSQINNNFNQLCQLESLWKNQIENKNNVLFKKDTERNHYRNCKIYILTIKRINEILKSMAYNRLSL